MNWGFGAFLEDDEKVLRVFRRPVIFTLPWLIIRLALWGGVVGVVWFFYPAYNQMDLSYVWQGLALLGIIHTLAPLWQWYVNALVMTNESLIIVDWPRLWERRSTRIDFHNLDEITVERTGIKSFMLNYGNLLLAKINGGGEHVVSNLSRPRRAARIMEDYREWHLDQKNFTEESALKGLLSGIVQRHVGDAGQPERRKAPERYETQSEPNQNVVPSHPTDRVPTSETNQQPITEKIKRPFRRKNFDNLDDIEVEKRLDDTGGLDIDLED